MNLLSKNEIQIVNGLYSTINEVKGLTSRSNSKPKKMLQKYLQENHINTIQTQCMSYYLDTALYKYTLQTISLEQLWAMSMKTRNLLLSAIENCIDRLSTENDEEIIISYLLENFLFQTESFNEIYMIYILNSLGIKFNGMITTEKFLKQLKLILKANKSDKVNKIIKYYEHFVYGTDKNFENNWGRLVKSLRDKIAHRDVLRPNFESNEKLSKEILFDWPTIQGISIERFCQEIDNRVFDLLKFTSSTIYESCWPK